MACVERACKFYEGLVEALIAFADHVFRQSKSTSDGSTVADHQESAARQFEALGKKKIAANIQPQAPPFPHEIAYVWSWFNQISSGLLVTGMGPSVLTWEGLYAWQQLTATAMEPWEVDCLMRLSVTRAVINSEEQKKKVDASAKPKNSRRPR